MAITPSEIPTKTIFPLRNIHIALEIKKEEPDKAMVRAWKMVCGHSTFKKLDLNNKTPPELTTKNLIFPLTHIQISLKRKRRVMVRAWKESRCLLQI